MINKVYISGQLAQAIYQEDENYFSLGLDQIERPNYCTSAELSLFFNSGAELLMLEDKTITLEKIKSTVELAANRHHALTFTISGFNPELTLNTRQLSIEAANDLIQFSDIQDFVENRLLSRKLPPNNDLKKAIELSKDLNCVELHHIYQKVDSSIKIIENLLIDWQQVSVDFFASEEEITSCENQLIDFGVFARLVMAINQKDFGQLDTIVFDVVG